VGILVFVFGMLSLYTMCAWMLSSQVSVLQNTTSDYNSCVRIQMHPTGKVNILISVRNFNFYLWEFTAYRVAA
jgi:hypothetical protein